MEENKKKNELDDLELIRRGMNTARVRGLAFSMQMQAPVTLKKENVLGDKERKVREERVARELTAEERSEVEKELKLFVKGYELLIEEVKSKAVDSMFSAHPNLDAVGVEECVIDTELMEKIKETLLDLGLNKTCYIDQACGYSGEVLLNFYEIGTSLYYQADIEKCIPIFTFLTNLTPDVESFWIALGLAFEKNLEFEKAFAAYEFIIKMGVSDFIPFFGVLRCSEELRDFTKAIELLEKQKENEIIKNEVEEAFSYISLVRKQGVVMKKI